MDNAIFPRENCHLFPLSALSVSSSVVSDSLRPHGLTVARQAPLSMEFSRQEYWSRLPFPSAGDLPNPEVEPGSPALRADSLPSEPPGKLKFLSKQYDIINYRYYAVS